MVTVDRYGWRLLLFALRTLAGFNAKNSATKWTSNFSKAYVTRDSSGPATSAISVQQ